MSITGIDVKTLFSGRNKNIFEMIYVLIGNKIFEFIYLFTQFSSGVKNCRGSFLLTNIFRKLLVRKLTK